jgi:putative copper export protein
MWPAVRFLHLIAMAFFVGGELMLVAAVVPAVRRHGTDLTMRSAARRFGIGSVVALAVLVATGAAMASHYDRWRDGVLQAKLSVLVLAGVLLGLHTVAPQRRVLSVAVFVASLAIVWLGVELAHG